MKNTQLIASTVRNKISSLFEEKDIDLNIEIEDDEHIDVHFGDISNEYVALLRQTFDEMMQDFAMQFANSKTTSNWIVTSSDKSSLVTLSIYVRSNYQPGIDMYEDLRENHLRIFCYIRDYAEKHGKDIKQLSEFELRKAYVDAKYEDTETIFQLFNKHTNG